MNIKKAIRNIILGVFSMVLMSPILDAQRVGVNVTNPTVELDVRTTFPEDAANINLANSNNTHYLRLFSGKPFGSRINPSIFWNSQDSLVFGVVESQFTELARLNSDGDLLLRKGGIAMGLNSTDGFMEIQVDSTFETEFGDQVSSGPSVNTFSIKAGSSAGQTISIGEDGFLQYVYIKDIYKEGAGPSFLRMNVYSGSGPSGVLQGSDIKEINCEQGTACSDFPLFKFSDLEVSEGQEIFLELIYETGSNMLVELIDGDSYSPASAWIFESGAWSMQPLVDLGFETIIRQIDSVLVPFFKITKQGKNSKVQIKDYFLPNKNGSAGQILVASSNGHVEWGEKSDNDWSISSNAVFTDTKKVGIGNNDPETALHVRSDLENNGTVAALKIETASTGSPDQHMLIDGNEIDAWGGEETGDDDMLLLQNNSVGDLNMVLGGGKIGIGKINEDEGKVVILNQGAGPALVASKLGSNLKLYGALIESEEIDGGPSALSIQNSGYLYLATSAAGKIGIGTTDIPDDYKVAVAGKIVTEEVLVQHITDWPDYVFRSDYDLMELTEVKAFIEKESHLPKVPSENEVYKSGVKLGEMQKILLEKIEELTLYIINQDERIEHLEQLLKNK